MKLLQLESKDLIQFQGETWVPYASQTVNQKRVRLDVNLFGTFRVSVNSIDHNITKHSHNIVKYEGKNSETAIETFNFESQ